LSLKLKVAVTAAAAMSALAVPAAAAATTLIGSGSSAEQPILAALFAGYGKTHKNVHFVYTADGGNAGIKDVQGAHSVFAVNTRAPLPSDSGTEQVKLFLDGLCVAVNKSNSLSNLSIAHARQIFLGQVTTWSQVAGANLSSTIDPIGRDSAAGSYTFFQQSVLNDQTQASNVEQLSADGLVASAIKKDKSAIGYVGLSHTGKGTGIKAIKLNGWACSAANIKTEKYPMSRFIWGVLSSKHPSKAAATFFDWVRTSPAAGKLIAKTAVPAFNKKK
jgi:phosphate transport system substrate-binding protein